MKEGQPKSLFDVWVRVKPFKAYSSNIETCSEELYSPIGKARRTVPNAFNRSRSKSPLSTTPVGKNRILNEREKNTALKYLNDFQAINCEETQLLVKETVEEIGKEPKLDTKKIPFPHIIDDSQDNWAVFQKSLQPKIRDCLEGKSFTLLTYGISGSGKSHTIFGSQREGLKERGLLYYFMKSIFEAKAGFEDDRKRTFSMTISFIEIYNEQVRDLLVDNNHKRLNIVENPFTVGVSVPDLTTKPLVNFEDLQKDMDFALGRRVVCPNLNNHQSSRSHLIVEVTIESFDKSNLEDHLLSKVRFVDLAGSEKVSFEAKDVIQEGANINKSLLSLTNCINVLSDGKKKESTFIPYRNSKLTRLLKDSLGGHTPVLMIVCLSPNSCYIEETMNSLKYAQKAKKIKESQTLNPVFNISMGPGANDKLLKQKVRIEELEREVRILRDQLSKVSSLQQHDKEKEVLPMKKPLKIQRKVVSTMQITPEEYGELIEQLCTGYEELNSLKMTLNEVDKTITLVDGRIISIQEAISTSLDYGATTNLYQELKELADLLESNLDLKEDILAKIDKQTEAIDEIKATLKNVVLSSQGFMNSSQNALNEVNRYTQVQNTGGVQIPQLALEKTAGFEEPMLSSYRDRASLMKEFAKRDAQIKQLSQALKNLSGIPPKNISENKENLKHENNLQKANLKKKKESGYLAGIVEDKMVQPCKEASHKDALSESTSTVSSVISKLLKQYQPSVQIGAASTCAGMEIQDRSLPRQSVKSGSEDIMELELGIVPIDCEKDRLGVAYQKLSYYSANMMEQMDHEATGTNPMSIFSSGQMSHNSQAVRDLNTNDLYLREQLLNMNSLHNFAETCSHNSN